LSNEIAYRIIKKYKKKERTSEQCNTTRKFIVRSSGIGIRSAFLPAFFASFVGMVEIVFDILILIANRFAMLLTSLFLLIVGTGRWSLDARLTRE
jgi:hypothetical protein